MTDNIKKDVTITENIGGVFGVGLYENERHYPGLSITYKDVDWSLEEIEKRRKQLTDMLYKDLEHREEISRIKALEKRYSDIRWYESGNNGIKYPNVTSVINIANPRTWYIDENQKRGLSARGQALDIYLQNFIKTKEWTDIDKIPEALRHLEIMKKENYDIENHLIGLQSFVEKYNVKFSEGHQIVINHEHKYGGTLDCICYYNEDGVRTLADLKAFSQDKESVVRGLKQCAAYAIALKDKIDRIALFPIHDGNKQNFSKPAESMDINAYFKMFLQDRETFRQTFGV